MWSFFKSDSDKVRDHMRANDTLRRCPDCGKESFSPNGNMEERETPGELSNYEVLSSEWECSECSTKYKETPDGRMLPINE